MCRKLVFYFVFTIALVVIKYYSVRLRLYTLILFSLILVEN